MVIKKKFPGLRIFILEEQPLVALNLETMLQDLGCVIIGTAMRLHDAEKMVATLEADLAVLNVNINGFKPFGLASQLHEHMPLLFTTGSSSLDIPMQFQKSAVLYKPYLLVDLEEALTRIFFPE